MENKRFTFTGESIFDDQFDGTLQKYRWEAGFPNHRLDSWSQWTSIIGFVYARHYTELINTIHHQLRINGYPEHLSIKWGKCERNNGKR